MWSIENTETTTATPEELWACYVDTDSGPSWDPLVAEIKLHGPFATGTTGTNKPPVGPKLKFIFTEVIPFSSYTEVTKAPGAEMTFTHSLTSTPNGTTFTHGIICQGLLSGLYALILRKNYTRLLPIAMKALAHTAPQGQKSL